MPITFLGTSNCITHGSFVPHAGAALGELVRNLSIGASSSAVGLYYLDRMIIADKDPVILDYAINDSGYISAGLKSDDAVTSYLGTIVARIRKAGGIPILLIVPSYAGLNKPSVGEEVHLQFCEANCIHYLNTARLFREALAMGCPRDILMRDESHMSATVTPVIGELISEAVQALRAAETEPVSAESRDWRVRVIKAESLVPPDRLIEHASSFYKAPFLVLRSAERLTLNINATEMLVGVMANTGALGGNLRLVGDRTIVKSMTIYWDAARPDWFTSIMVDLVEPLRGSPSGITIELVGENMVATEGTLHHKPTLPGRYGEVQIEGFLVAKPGAIEPLSYAQPKLGYDLLHSLPRQGWLQDLMKAAASTPMGA